MSISIAHNTVPSCTATEDDIRQWYKRKYINTTGYILLIKRILGLPSDELVVTNVLEFCREWEISKSAFYRAVEELRQNNDIDWNAKEYSKTEAKIRDRLQQELEGLTEVQTLAGRIDLLTETQVIEVKHVSEWKAAMGQVLAYSGFYPNHQKRMHLFGNKDQMVSPTAITVCNELDIIITFEEIES